MGLCTMCLFTFLMCVTVASAQSGQRRCVIEGDALGDYSNGCNWNIDMSFQDIIDNNPDIEYLDINGDGGSGYPNLGTIPDSIETLWKLQIIELRRISSCIGSIPASVARLPLIYLRLDELDLDGTFPEEIFKMESLDTLYLHRIGDRLDPLDLPALGIPSIQSITIVDIPTTSNFPIEWVNSASKIRNLKLCNLKLDGVISEIRPDRLSRLHLINNQLSGELPQITDAPWEKLVSLRLEGNNFVGSIPAEYVDYIRDHSLELSIVPNVQLSGVVPIGSQMCRYERRIEVPTLLWDCRLKGFAEEDRFILPIRIRGERCNRDANCVNLFSDEDRISFAKCAYGYCCDYDTSESCLQCKEGYGGCIEDGQEDTVPNNRTVGQSCNRDANCVNGSGNEGFAKCAYGYCCNNDAPSNCVECAQGSGECTNVYQEGQDRNIIIMITLICGTGILMLVFVSFNFRKLKQEGGSTRGRSVARPEDVPRTQIDSDASPTMSI